MFVEPSTVFVGSMGSRCHLRMEWKNFRIHVDLSSFIGSIDDDSACAAAAVRNFATRIDGFSRFSSPTSLLCFFVAHKFNASKRGAIFIAIISFSLSRSFASFRPLGRRRRIFFIIFSHSLCWTNYGEKRRLMQISPKKLGEKMWNFSQTFMSQNVCNEIKIRLFDQRESDGNVQIRWQSCSCTHAPLRRVNDVM